MDSPAEDPSGPATPRKRSGPPDAPSAPDATTGPPGGADAGGSGPAADPGPVQPDGRTGAPRRGREAGYPAHPAQVEAGARSGGPDRSGTARAREAEAQARRRAEDRAGLPRGALMRPASTGKAPALQRCQSMLAAVALRTLRNVDAEIRRCERLTLDAQYTAAAAGKPVDDVPIRLPDADTRWWLDVASKAVLGMTTAQLRRDQLAIAAERAKRGQPAAPGDPTLPDDALVERVLLDLPDEAFAAIAKKRAEQPIATSNREALVLAGQPHTRADRR